MFNISNISTDFLAKIYRNQFTLHEDPIRQSVYVQEREFFFVFFCIYK